MSKQSGLGDHLLIDGYDFSGDIGSLSRIGGGNSPLVVTGITVDGMERIGGKRDGAIEFNSFYNPATDREHDVLSTLPTADRIVTYCRGFGTGKQAASVVGKQLNYDPTRGEDGGFTIAVSVEGNGYGLEWGDQYTDGFRTDTAATNGAAVDYGAASSFGLQAWLQVTWVAGTSVTVALEDSADNVTFGAIAGGAFTAATVTSAQRIQTARAATIKRYVRVVTTGTFSSATFLVQVTRNDQTVNY